MITETRPIPGMPGMYATSEGQIIGRSGTVLRARLSGKYLRINAWHEGRHQTFQVNRLVCAAFHGECPDDKEEAAHGDGDRLNNRPENLRWATKLENAADKHRHGTTVRGTRVNTNKLTEAQVLEIRRRLAEGEYGTELAKEFGVHQTVISKINRREIWAHL